MIKQHLLQMYLFAGQSETIKKLSAWRKKEKINMAMFTR